jgi:5-methylcytosine-specific restriction endonuclease McrA
MMDLARGIARIVMQKRTSKSSRGKSTIWENGKLLQRQRAKRRESRFVCAKIAPIANIVIRASWDMILRMRGPWIRLQPVREKDLNPDIAKDALNLPK